MSHRWIVTVIGKDRPGIVAGVTKVLYQLGCNLEDSAMTRLESEFTIMLIFEAPARVTAQRLQRAFAAISRTLGLTVHLKQLSSQESRAPASGGRRYMISVYGADHPGIVYRVSERLAKAKVNILDVHTHRTAPGRGRGKASLYMLLLDVELPARQSPEALDRTLRQLAKRLGVEVNLRASEANVL